MGWDGGEKLGGRRGRGREIGGIRVCVRDLMSQGWERRGVREVERVGGGRGRVRESKGWEGVGRKTGRGWERD